MHAWIFAKLLARYLSKKETLVDREMIQKEFGKVVVVLIEELTSWQAASQGRAKAQAGRGPLNERAKRRSGSSWRTKSAMCGQSRPVRRQNGLWSGGSKTFCGPRVIDEARSITWLEEQFDRTAEEAQRSLRAPARRSKR
jgi:hypothetical protein